MENAIKVTQTRMLELHRREDGWHWSGETVAEGRLVLIANYKMTDLPSVELFGNNDKTNFKIGSVNDHLVILKSGFINYKPIIISETEKIEVGVDYMYAHGQIQEPDSTYKEITGSSKKILVLPEQFSPKHLQAIVDGSMKNGDKVLVECERVKHLDTQCENICTFVNSLTFNERLEAVRKECNSDECKLGDKHKIKLNSQGHATFYKDKAADLTINLAKAGVSVDVGADGNFIFTKNGEKMHSGEDVRKLLIEENLSILNLMHTHNIDMRVCIVLEERVKNLNNQ